MNKILGITLVVLALAIAVVPHFTDCYSQGNLVTLANGNTQPMKCHWTAQSEIAVGIPLAGIGAMLAFSRRKSTAMGLSVIGVVLGAMALALPYSLIGTCIAPTHICNTAMKPALTILGSLGIIGSLGAVMSARKLQS
jgi:hypothetical protein